ANVKAVGGDNGVTAAIKNNDQAKTDTQVKEEKTKVESKETAKEASKETKNENGKAEKTDNPKTGDEARIGLFATLILISGVFLIR
ncbi:sortase B protein-sorting domain-containing protein, partial [Bacillus cereus group sp. BfR-BA-01381]